MTTKPLMALYTADDLRTCHVHAVIKPHGAYIQWLRPLTIDQDAPVLHRKRCRKTGTCVCINKLSRIDWTRWDALLSDMSVLHFGDLTTDPKVTHEVDGNETILEWIGVDLPFNQAVMLLVRKIMNVQTTLISTLMSMHKAIGRETVYPLYGLPHTKMCAENCDCDTPSTWDWLTWQFDYLDDSDFVWEGFIHFEDEPATFTFVRVVDGHKVKAATTTWPPESFDLMVREAFLTAVGKAKEEDEETTLPITAPPPPSGPDECLFPEAAETTLNFDIPKLDLYDVLVAVGESCNFVGWYGAWIEGESALYETATDDTITTQANLKREMIVRYTNRLRNAIPAGTERGEMFRKMHMYLNTQWVDRLLSQWDCSTD